MRYWTDEQFSIVVFETIGKYQYKDWENTDIIKFNVFIYARICSLQPDIIAFNVQEVAEKDFNYFEKSKPVKSEKSKRSIISTLFYIFNDMDKMNARMNKN